MLKIKGLESLDKSFPNTVLTIGNFDSVHLGHQKIFQKVISRAKELRGTSMVMTFDPHPAKLLAPERNVKLLTTTDEKERLLGDIGLDVLLCVRFNQKFSHILPDEFIKDILVDRINVKEIIVGSQYVFGRKKQGTVDLLRKRGKKYGFTVSAVRKAKIQGQVVSSSLIRSLLLKGAVDEAAIYLGRAYSIKGKVIRGKGRGKRLLNIPTANITTPVEIAPKEGVYAVKVRFNGKMYKAVANIGKNPTFGNIDVSYEVHLLNFAENLMGKHLRVYFIKRIRGEKTFRDITGLQKQIRNDIQEAREILIR